MNRRRKYRRWIEDVQLELLNKYAARHDHYCLDTQEKVDQWNQENGTNHPIGWGVTIRRDAPLFGWNDNDHRLR